MSRPGMDSIGVAGEQAQHLLQRHVELAELLETLKALSAYQLDSQLSADAWPAVLAQKQTLIESMVSRPLAELFQATGACLDTLGHFLAQPLATQLLHAATANRERLDDIARSEASAVTVTAARMRQLRDQLGGVHQVCFARQAYRASGHHTVSAYFLDKTR